MEHSYSKLSKQLVKYGDLSAAISRVVDASGQIVYTDVIPDFKGASGEEFFLDLNQDGIDDLRIQKIDTTDEPLTASKSVLGNTSVSYCAYPFALSSVAVISAGQVNQGGFTAKYGTFSKKTFMISLKLNNNN